MPSRWTADQVTGLAPDSASVAAGRKLASPGVWSADGSSAAAVWGLAKGSGKQPYQTAVDLSGPAYKCSCPSRKIPCKHVLGLLLRWADGAVGEAEPPPFVAEWLEARSERAVASEERAERRASAEADPDARAKRQAKRAASIEAGLRDLDRLLTDLMREGLATARERPASAWDDHARRLVDAQSPALAARLRELAHTLHAGAEGWPAAALGQAGALHLVARAWQRVDELPDELRDDLRAQLGWPRTTEEVRTISPPVAGPWAAVGSRTVDDDRLRTRRTWLLHAESGRPGLLLDFAAGPSSLPAGLVTGTLLTGAVHPYPGRGGLRVATSVEGLAAAGVWPGPGADATVEAALQAWGAALARDPFLTRLPIALAGVVPLRAHGRWWLRDEAGAALAIDGAEPWELLALSGGQPLGVTAEFDGEQLTPLAAFDAGRLWHLGSPDREASAA